MVELAIFFSCLFALNIGGSGAAAAMGVSYGSGAVKKISTALIICAVGIFLGAWIGGGEVVKTIGSGIINSDLLSVEIVVIILASATLSLFIANIAGIPLSTSEVTVGAVVGIGVAYQSVFIGNLFSIVALWIVIPFIAFLITLLLQTTVNVFLNSKIGVNSVFLSVLLTVTGFFEAFSAGMNNVANAVGPLVGAGIMSEGNGILLGALFVSLGVLLLGRNVLITNGKRITQFSKIEGITISATGAILVIIASIFGIPVPMTQITTSSILGIGFANEGKGVFRKDIVKRLLKIWIVSPLISLIISYSIVQAFIFSNWYSFIVVIIVFVATIVGISLSTSIKKFFTTKA